MEGKKLTDSFFNFLTAIARQRHLVALRDGMIASIPLILVGSTFLLLGAQKDVLTQYFPSLATSPFGKWYGENAAGIMMPFRFTMGMLSLYVTFAIAASLAGQYKMPVLPQAMGAGVTFLLTVKIIQLPLPETGKMSWMLPLGPLGGDGLFLAIICALFTVELSRGIMVLWNRIFPPTDSKNSKDEIPAEEIIERTEEKALEEDTKISNSPQPNTQAMEIPPAVSEAFISFVPLFAVIFVVWLIGYNFKIDIYSALIGVMKPLEKMGDTVWCVAAVNFFMHIFGFAGLHGISVINGVFFALWQKFLLINTEAHMSGMKLLPAVTAYPFYQWFVWAGGAGTTLPVPFMLLFFKNTHMKNIGKVSLVPSLFNVNEPLLFGLPVVANPILAVPFILAPIICGITAFFAFNMNLITRPFIEVPWVMPAFLGAPLCTQDGRAFILLMLNITISAVIWYPFLRAYEKRLKQ